MAFLKYAVIGIFHGTLWWRLGVGKVSDRVAVLFFSLMFVLFDNEQSIPKIFFDRLLFYREKGAGVYGPVEYWLSITFAPVGGVSFFCCCYFVLISLYFSLKYGTYPQNRFFFVICVVFSIKIYPWLVFFLFSPLILLAPPSQTISSIPARLF